MIKRSGVRCCDSSMIARCNPCPCPKIMTWRTTRNTACNGNLIPLCRMMRAWKRQWGVPIGGLLVDTLAYRFINEWAYRGKSYVYYDWMCRDFFNFMREQDKEQTYWKAPGSGQYVYGKGLFQWKAFVTEDFKSSKVITSLRTSPADSRLSRCKSSGPETTMT